MKSPAATAANRRWSKSTKGRAVKKRLEVARNAKVRAFINDLKSVPCADCWERFDPICMDFDHRPGEEKKFCIGRQCRGVSRESLLAEIAKCDVVCANCHRIRTHRERDHRVTMRKRRSK